MAPQDWAGLEPLDLVRCRAPLRPVTLPSGRTVAVVPFDAAAVQLERVARAGGPDAEAAAQALVQRCVPDLEPLDYEYLTPEDYRHLIAHARGQLDAVLVEMERRRGKAPATPIGLTASRTASEPSPRTTRSAWWSRVWRRRPAATSGRSTASRTT